jgi:hypothetical protein
MTKRELIDALALAAANARDEDAHGRGYARLMRSAAAYLATGGSIRAMADFCRTRQRSVMGLSVPHWHGQYRAARAVLGMLEPQ